MHSPHSRLAGYTSGSSLNPFQGSIPQSYQGLGGMQFQPIPQSYSLPFQPTNEIPPYTNVTREQATSPWGQSISPQWSWQSNVASSPSSQRSTPQPHHTPHWGTLSPPLMPNPNRPQSVIHSQVPHTLLPSIEHRRGAPAYNPLRPPSRSHGLLSRGEPASSLSVSHLFC